MDHRHFLKVFLVIMFFDCRVAVTSSTIRSLPGHFLCLAEVQRHSTSPKLMCQPFSYVAKFHSQYNAMYCTPVTGSNNVVFRVSIICLLCLNSIAKLQAEQEVNDWHVPPHYNVSGVDTMLDVCKLVTAGPPPKGCLGNVHQNAFLIHSLCGLHF